MANKKKNDKEKQGELPGMPERTPAGKYAIEYIDYRDRIDELSGKMSECAKNLVEAMNQENLSRITVKGRTLYPKYVEASIKISIKKEG